MAEYRYKYNPPNRNNNPKSRNNEIAMWIIGFLLLVALPPLGILFVIFNILSTYTNRTEKTSAKHTQPLGSRTSAAAATASPSLQPVPAPKKDPGKVMTVVGAILTALFGFVSLVVLADSLWMLPDVLWLLEKMIPLLGVLGGSAGLLWCGLRKQKQSRRFRKYLSLIGKRHTIPIATLAQAMPATPATVRHDLEIMLDRGYLPAGFLNYANDTLFLSESGLSEEPQAPKPEPDCSPQEDEAILADIRAVNESIAHAGLSAQILRIEEITGKILDYQKTHPEKASQLRSFLNYYLPATLKILHAYARLEAQGVEGENISAAMSRIEDMMSKVVEGFEKQLDQLFQSDAMDITTDVEVLERMLSKDGLSSSGNLTLEI